ncbi:ATP-binding protein [Deinococcus sp. QL22]|uniref:sensor histidine kinase n=1 Tax=Deinococcus sp. QL22 TaxID=2939437 RepID=UPI002016D83C|nr:ATP-binding protein [Deinococcus sp. QL22]UQN10758.1 ATP-binding protein [Deinococcus sp. QL22]UQN10804.1 ATP-binding protein [Deinococcus sp. QL22]
MSDDAEQIERIRAQAELELQARPPPSLHLVSEDPAAVLQELHRERQELQLHQIELRLQNDELGRINTELEDARQEYQELFDFAPVGYLTLDRNGAIQRVNLTLCQLLGMERPRLLRRRLSSFLDPADVSTFSLFLRRVWERPGPWTAEVWLIGVQGTRFAVQLRGEAIRGADGQSLLSRLTVTDITPQRQAQEEVSRLNASLEDQVQQRTQHIQELNTELETFVYALTHDLTTPLRHIRSFTGLLAKQLRPLEEQQERYVQHVEHSVNRMEEQLSALLTLFRVSQGRMRFQPVQLERVIREVRQDLAADLDGRDVQVTVHELPTVQGDSLALKLVFASLLGNALKFTRGRTPAQISVQAREDEQEFIISMRDNGVGFNMRQKSRLFTMFQRLHRQEEFEGSGVGLALVQRVIHRHGGRVWAEGTPGEGATFWLSLPKDLLRKELR